MYLIQAGARASARAGGGGITRFDLSIFCLVCNDSQSIRLCSFFPKHLTINLEYYTYYSQVVIQIYLLTYYLSKVKAMLTTSLIPGHQLSAVFIYRNEVQQTSASKGKCLTELNQITSFQTTDLSAVDIDCSPTVVTYSELNLSTTRD